MVVVFIFTDVHSRQQINLFLTRRLTMEAQWVQAKAVFSVRGSYLITVVEMYLYKGNSKRIDLCSAVA